jgi:hypothetical protein
MASMVPPHLNTRLISVAGMPLVDTADPLGWIHATDAPHATMIEFAIQHGHHMAALEVHVCRNPRDHKACDEAIEWLCESLSESVSGVVGMDAEGGGSGRNAAIQVLQLATDTRCVLVLLQEAKLPIVFSPRLVDLLQRRDLGKAGAELWTDAIDVWSVTHGRTLVNGCLDLNYVDDNDNDGETSATATQYHPSLAVLCNQALGDHNAFVKDKETTCSDWSRRQLSWRQLIYAALDAQASHYAAAAAAAAAASSANVKIITPFHLSDLRVDLLERIVVWKAELRLQETAIEQLTRVKVDVSRIESVADDYIAVYMCRYSTRIRHKSLVWASVRDDTKTGRVTLVALVKTKLDGQRALLKAPAIGLHARSNSIIGISLSRQNEATYSADQRAVARMLGRLLRGTLRANLVRTSLDLNLVEAAAAARPIQTTTTTTEQELASVSVSALAATTSTTELDFSQREALELADACPLVVLQGPPGTGKSFTIGCRARQLVVERRSGEQLWCVAATNMAVRNMALAISKVVPATYLCVCVSREFHHEWHTAEYAELVALGCVYLGQPKDAPARPIMLTTLSMAFTLLEHRPQLARDYGHLIVDEASQVAAMSALALLEVAATAAPTAFARVLIVGDDAQLPPFDSRRTNKSAPVASVLTFFNEAAILFERRKVLLGRTSLLVQYRMPEQLGRAINDTFYGGSLTRGVCVDKTLQPQAHITWVESPADARVTTVGTSLVNKREAATVHQMCVHFLNANPDFDVRSLVVLSFYDAQTALLIKLLQPLGVRACNVDSFQGQEAKVVCVSLVADRRPSAFLTDARRINVACSRAQHQLVLCGRRAIFKHPSAGAWHRLLACIDQGSQLF